MKILCTKEGWNSKGLLVIVSFELAEHPKQCTAFVLFDKRTGNLRLPTWAWDNERHIELSPEAKAEVEAAARKFAGKRVPRAA